MKPCTPSAAAAATRPQQPWTFEVPPECPAWGQPVLHPSLGCLQLAAYTCVACSCPAEKPGVKGVTTPLDVATAISKGLAKKVVVAKVDGAVWDLTRPLEGDCALQLLSFDDAEGKEVRACR